MSFLMTKAEGAKEESKGVAKSTIGGAAFLRQRGNMQFIILHGILVVYQLQIECSLARSSCALCADTSAASECTREF